MFLYARVTRESSPLEEGIVYVESEVFVVVCVATKQERAGMCVERIGWKPNRNNYFNICKVTLVMVKCPKNISTNMRKKSLHFSKKSN